MENKSSRAVGPLMIVASGCLWGVMGLFRRHLGALGLSSYGVVFVRCASAALLFALTILFTDRSKFRIRIRDLWCFIGSGIFSLLFFTICYFQAMTLMSLSTAAILLYTAPCFVIVISAILFKEKITPAVLVSLVLAFAGCCFVSGITGGSVRLSTAGLLYGLGSGIGYALYTIFSKLAMQRGYTSLTINFYSCSLAAIGVLFICDAGSEFSAAFASGSSIMFCLLAGIVTCYLPYLLYTSGLAYVEAGSASIMASIEPVVATVAGIAVYKEPLSLGGITGIVLVMAAIVITNIKPRKRSSAEKMP